MKPLQAKDIFGNWATLLLPIADDDTIDFDALAVEIDRLIAMKVNGIYSNGTAGEFYNQTEAEFDQVSELLAGKCNDAGMPFQLGCSHTNPTVSMERLKRVLPLAPGAVQVILPDWFPPTMTEVVSFLQKMQEAAGEVGLVLYNPPHAKRRLQPVDFGVLADAGIRLSGCKLAGGDEAWYRSMKQYAPELSLFIPGHHLATGISRGAHGAYSNVACLHPSAAQRWYEDMATDMPRALELESRIQQFITNHILPYILEHDFSNQAVDKFMAAVGGWTAITPRLRWPYRSIPATDVSAVQQHLNNILPEFTKTQND